MDKKLVVNGFWLVVNGDLASCKVKLLYSFLKSDCTTEDQKLHRCAVHVYRDLTKSTSRFTLEIAIFIKFPLVVH